MRKITVVLTLLLLLACRRKDRNYSEEVVPVDSANKMLESYLNSIGYSGNDSLLQSLSFDANVLRDYLTATAEGTSVTGIKVMFAHTLDYINGGHGDADAGYRSGELTLLMVGYDNSGNYILHEGGAINNAMPCPTNCPPGDAAGPFLPIVTSRDD